MLVATAPKKTTIKAEAVTKQKQKVPAALQSKVLCEASFAARLSKMLGKLKYIKDGAKKSTEEEKQDHAYHP